MDYSEYIKSGDWLKLKLKKIAKRKRKGRYFCYACGSKENLVMRILRYRRNMEKTKSNDLEVFCKDCADILYTERKNLTKGERMLGPIKKANILKKRILAKLGKEQVITNIPNKHIDTVLGEREDQLKLVS